MTWRRSLLRSLHCSDVIMSPMASQITGISIVYPTVCSGADQRKHKAPGHWPLWGEFTGDRWIPLTKSQQSGKCFHLMTSLWAVFPPTKAEFDVLFVVKLNHQLKKRSSRRWFETPSSPYHCNVSPAPWHPGDILKGLFLEICNVCSSFTLSCSLKGDHMYISNALLIIARPPWLNPQRGRLLIHYTAKKGILCKLIGVFHVYASINWDIISLTTLLVCHLVGTKPLIAWTSADLFRIGPLSTNFKKNQSKIQYVSFKKIDLKISSAKSRPFCLRPKVLHHSTAWRYDIFQLIMIFYKTACFQSSLRWLFRWSVMISLQKHFDIQWKLNILRNTIIFRYSTILMTRSPIH